MAHTAKQKELVLMRGLPASGKSTWARAQLTEHPGVYKVISKDTLRAMLDGGVWSKRNETFILQVRDTLVGMALAAGFSVIVDDTNLHPPHITALTALGTALQATVRVQDFTDVSLEECLARDKQRPNYVGEAVIKKMYRDFLAPKVLFPPPPLPPLLPKALICDLDGTLCLFGEANPYDRDFSKDYVNPVVAGILERFSASHYIVLLSGRKEAARAQTEGWLKGHGIRHDYLWMRANGDTRKDVIVKRELYETHIKDTYGVVFVIDDRQSVVDMWREVGLICLQVAEGSF